MRPCSRGSMEYHQQTLVGRCRSTLSNPHWKRLELSAGNYDMMSRFQTLLSISTCAATPWRTCARR